MESTVRAIPRGYHTITQSLVVEGANKLIDFLKQTFDAKEEVRMDMPDGTVGHVELMVGDSRLMIGEATAEWKAMPGRGYLYVNDADAVYGRALKAGATSIREPADQFYGDRSAVVKDPCGNVWTIATHKEDVSMDEMKRRIALQSG
jgi:PhnB protein